ncbi:MAG: holo-ACP synthase [bacterium]|nr:holo-ACP synthase [bacterium]
MEFSVGCDIEENKRFENKTIEKDKHFLEKIFTQNELKYCFSKSHPAQHLCARFCAKEAVIKALCSIGENKLFPSDIEVLNDENNVPKVDLKKFANLNVKISLSHCKNYSTATAIVYKAMSA